MFTLHLVGTLYCFNYSQLWEFEPACHLHFKFVENLIVSDSMNLSMLISCLAVNIFSIGENGFDYFPFYQASSKGLNYITLVYIMKPVPSLCTVQDGVQCVKGFMGNKSRILSVLLIKNPKQ